MELDLVLATGLKVLKYRLEWIEQTLDLSYRLDLYKIFQYNI